MAQPMRNLAEDPEFQAYYRRHLEPMERELEAHRVRATRERTKRAAAAALVWAAAIGLVLYWMRPVAEVAWWTSGIFMFLAAVMLGIWAWLPVIAHIGRLKEQIVPKLVPFFGDLRYTWDTHIPVSTFSRSRALPRYTKEYVEDLIEGTHHGVPLRALEISLSYTRATGSGSSRSTRLERVFKGLLVELLTGAHFPGVTLLGTEGMFERHFAISEDSGLRHAETADGFDIYTDAGSNGHSGAADLRRKLADVARRLDAQRIVCSLAGDRIVLLIEHREDFFELSTRQVTNFRRDAELVGAQLDGLFSIVDTLGVVPPDQGARLGPLVKLDAAIGPRGEIGHGTPESKGEDRYAFGSWGCLFVFASMLACIAGFGGILRHRIDGDALFGWSVLGGFLTSMGVYQGAQTFRRRSIAAAIVAALLLGGAGWILRTHLQEPEQAVSVSSPN